MCIRDSLDAMAHGIPIVAPRSGMLKQFVEEGVTGIHCELDAGSIAAAILQCLDDPAKCDWMGREARKRQRSLFTWEAAAGRLLDDWSRTCLLYTSDAADERSRVDLGGRRILKKKTHK